MSTYVLILPANQHTMHLFNRWLLVTLLTIAFALSLSWPTKITLAATTPALGAVSSYGILSSTYTNITTGTIISGDVGFTTAPAVNPGGLHINYGSGAPYAAAGIDQSTALSDLASQTCTFTFAPGAVDLATDTTHGMTGVYTPGVYCISGAASIGTAGITLNGSWTYIFRINGAFTTVDNSVVTLTGGASACDVFWTPTWATTLGASSTFVGIVIDNAGITVGANTTWFGIAASFGGTVTTNNSTIIAPICLQPVTPPTPATLHVIKQVVNGNSGNALPSDFTLHVMMSGNDVIGSPALGTGTPGTSYTLTPGMYSVSENANSAYIQSFTWACNASGNVSLTSGDHKTCTIINTYIPVVVPAVCKTGSNHFYDRKHIPQIAIDKTATPKALPNGSGIVTYTYTVRNNSDWNNGHWNKGSWNNWNKSNRNNGNWWNNKKTQALTNISVLDNKCSPVVFTTGDYNSNGKLDKNEVWKYSCSMLLTGTTTNTVTAIGYSDDICYTWSTSDTATVKVVVWAKLKKPIINVMTEAHDYSLPVGGGLVKYKHTVTNKGKVAIQNVTISDNVCMPIAGPKPKGDKNNNNLLDTNEKWIYTCQTTLTGTTKNTTTVTGEANGYTVSHHDSSTVTVAKRAKSNPKNWYSRGSH